MEVEVLIRNKSYYCSSLTLEKMCYFQALLKMHPDTKSHKIPDRDPNTFARIITVLAYPLSDPPRLNSFIYDRYVSHDINYYAVDPHYISTSKYIFNRTPPCHSPNFEDNILSCLTMEGDRITVNLELLSNSINFSPSHSFSHKFDAVEIQYFGNYVLSMVLIKK
jgi:hypothetical protein